MSVLVVVDHDRGNLAPASLEALTAARALDLPVTALTIGEAADASAGTLAAHGADTILQAHHDLLDDYGPETWGQVVTEAITATAPGVVLAPATDRGNEVMATAGARLDLPMVANCTTVAIDSALTRVRWGGSLLEETAVDAPICLLTLAVHAVEAEPATTDTAPVVEQLDVDLDPVLARSKVVDRVERAAGLTLATAPVVVGGGRGVGSAEGFASLEELAGLLGGVVGCSRAVTNNGWRNHADQVGQTGTRIAPTVYVACGISGAIQHWVGAMAAKHVIAVNTDAQANMVSKAGYAVIGDLHAVVPAISAEIRRRRSAAD
jgi:electron transfer flavoprotein alpha subunit